MDKYFSKDISKLNIADLTKPFKNRDVLVIKENGKAIKYIVDPKAFKKLKETFLKCKDKNEKTQRLQEVVQELLDAN